VSIPFRFTARADQVIQLDGETKSLRRPDRSGCSRKRILAARLKVKKGRAAGLSRALAQPAPRKKVTVKFVIAPWSSPFNPEVVGGEAQGIEAPRCRLSP